MEFFSRLWFRPYHSNRHVILHQNTKFSPNRSTRGGDMMSFRFLKMAAAAAQYYLLNGWDIATSGFGKQTSQLLMSLLQKVKIYHQTKFRWHISIHGWDITTYGLKKKTNVRHIGILLRPFPVICMWFCIKVLNFVQIGSPTAEIRRHIHFSRWRLQPLSTTSGFVFVDVIAFRRSKSIRKPSLVDVTQFAAEI